MWDKLLTGLFVSTVGCILASLFFAIQVRGETVETSVTILPAPPANTSGTPDLVDTVAPKLILPTAAQERQNGFYINSGPVQFYDYDYASVTLEWYTDEAAQSTFSYGYSSTQAIQETAFTDYKTVQRKTLNGITPGTTYYYSIVLEDSSGNSRIYSMSFVLSIASSPLPVSMPVETPLPSEQETLPTPDLTKSPDDILVKPSPLSETLTPNTEDTSRVPIVLAPAPDRTSDDIDIPAIEPQKQDTIPLGERIPVPENILLSPPVPVQNGGVEKMKQQLVAVLKGIQQIGALPIAQKTFAAAHIAFSQADRISRRATVFEPKHIRLFTPLTQSLHFGVKNMRFVYGAAKFVVTKQKTQCSMEPINGPVEAIIHALVTSRYCVSNIVDTMTQNDMNAMRHSMRTWVYIFMKSENAIL